MYQKIILINLIILSYFSGYLKSDKIKSLNGIGFRIPGDQLIVKDSLQSPISLIPRNHTLQFQYPILNKVISYIELGSNSNVYAEFTLSVDEKMGGMLIGSATAIHAKDFNLQISIFGFDTLKKPENFQSILHPEIGITGEMKPKDNDYDDEYEVEDDKDSYIHLGERQPGDYLIYEKLEHVESDIRRNQSITFYYIDTDYITHAQFTAFKTASVGAIYSEVTEHSLKAIIYDLNVFTLGVRFQVYGYKPQDKPIDYFPVIPKHLTTTQPSDPSHILESDDDFKALPESLNELSYDNLVNLINSTRMAKNKSPLCECSNSSDSINTKISLIITFFGLIAFW